MPRAGLRPACGVGNINYFMDKEQMKLKNKIQRTTLKMLMEPDQQTKYKIQNQLIKLKIKLNK